MFNSQLELYKDAYPYFHYKKATNPSKGLIVFIHGYASTSEYHFLFAQALLDYDYLAIELPGNNISPVIDIKDLSPKRLAKLVANLIIKLDLKDINLIGHSMGGGIAMMVANLISDRIRKMVLVCPMNSLGTFDLYHFWFKFNPQNKQQAIYLANYLLYDKQLLNHVYSDYVLNEMINLNVQTKKYQKHLKHQMASINNLWTLHQNEKHINVPTLLIVCKQDRCINYKTTIFNLSRKIDQLAIRVIKNCGHAPMIEQFDIYFQIIIDFLI